MKGIKAFSFLAVGVFLLVGFSNPSEAFWDNKFEQEVTKEAEAVKLVREV